MRSKRLLKNRKSRRKNRRLRKKESLQIERLEDRKLLAADFGLSSLVDFGGRWSVEANPSQFSEIHTNKRAQSSHEFFWEPVASDGNSLGDQPTNNPQDGDDDGSNDASLPLLPISENPVRNSNPGAPISLYLDFDGHFEPVWGAYSNVTTPVYDIDGDATTFNDTELARMQTAWEAVSEDFAPFNINVTTVEPAILGDGNTSNDNGVALRVAIGGSWRDWRGSSAGGVGYVDSFTSSIPNVVYVFSDDASVFFGETAGHEAGHAFGLEHQSVYDASGTQIEEYNQGNSHWQPIMGGGTSSPSITSTWHNGQNSEREYQDDLAILNSVIGYRSDDHGDVIANATTLSGSTAAGIIETNNDVDVFRFSVSESENTFRIRVDGVDIEQNLDAVLELRNSSGELIASSNPDDTLDAEIIVALTVGDYFVTVSKSSAYGYLGQYTVNIDEPPSGVTVSSAAEVLLTTESGQTASFDVVLDTKPTADVTISVISSDASVGVPSTSVLVFNPFNWNVPQTVVVTAVDDGEIGLPSSYTIALGPATSNDSEYEGLVIDDINLVNQDDDAPGWAFGLQSEADVRIFKIATGPNGNFFVSGRFGGTVDFDPGVNTKVLTAEDTEWGDGFLAKYTSTGESLWVQQYCGVDGIAYESGYGIDFDAAGNIYLAGASSTTTVSFGNLSMTSEGYNDAFVTKLDSNGNFQWVRSWGGTSNDYARGISVASDGSIHIVGEFGATVDFDPGSGTYNLTSEGNKDGYLLNLDGNGNFVSVLAIAGTQTNYLYQIDVDNAGDIYVAGKFKETAQFGTTDGLPTFRTDANGISDTFLMKVSLDGNSTNTEWVRTVAGTETQNFSRVGVDHAGDVHFTTYFKGEVDIDTGDQGTLTMNSAGNYDSLVSKWNASGNLQWHGQIAGSESNRVHELQFDNEDNVYYVGRFEGTADFNFGSVSTQLMSRIGQDTFVLKLGSDGSVQHISQVVQQASSSYRSIAVDAVGNVYVAADFEETIAFPTGEVLTSTEGGSDDAFVLKLNLAPGISISPSLGLVTTEDGGNASFDIVLDTQPTANVTIGLTSNDTSEGALSTTSLIFTPENWNVAQVVIVMGVDDGIVDGDVGYAIVTASASSADQGYDGLNPTDVSVTNLDNEFTEEVVFADSFEVGEWNGLWVEDSQNDWRRQTQRASDGNYSAEVDGRATDATLSVANAIEMSPYGSAELTFSWYIESGFDSGEYVRLDFWDGNSWNQILSLDGNQDQENTLHHELIELDPEYLNDDFKFRFRSKVSRYNEDANVDNVVLTATSLVQPANVVPVAVSDSYNIDEDTQLSVLVPGVLANDTDSDGDALIAQLVSGPDNGSLIFNPNGSFNYTPNLDFHGTDSFSYVANDGTENSNTAVVSIVVYAVNDAPVAGNNSASTSEDTKLVITAASLLGNDSDVDFDSLSISSFTQPSHGALVDHFDGTFAYVPEANHHGADSFTYTISDGNGGFDTANVNLTITQVNDAGSFGGDLTATTDEDTPIAGTATFADSIDGFSNPNFSLFSSTTSGIVTIDPNGNWSYTPEANFHGADSFIVSVTDDDGNNETQSINITVTPVADLSASNDVALADEDTLLTGNVASNDSTTSGGVLSYAVDSGPINGSLGFNPDGSFSFTPNGNYHGSDGFTYTVTDSFANETETRAVSITINQVNDAGLFTGDLAATTDENLAVNGTTTFTDTADGFSSANFILSSVASNGIALVNPNGDWSYTPNPAFFGFDGFEVSITDDDGNVESQVLSITINEITELTANDDSYSVDEDGSLVGNVASNDSTTSGGVLSYAVDSGPSNGVLTAFNIDGSFLYSPDANFNGADSFTYVVNDAESGESSTQFVSIAVNQLNDSGSFGGDLSATTDEDTAVGGTVIFTDPIDGDSAPGFVISTAGTHGSSSIDASGNWIYTPDANYHGADSFEVSASDDDGNIESQLISVTVMPVADLMAFDDAFYGDEDTIITGNVGSNDTTTSGGVLSFAVIGVPNNGTVDLNSNGSFDYTPEGDYRGIDSFSYQVTDVDAGEVDTRTVIVTVDQINDGGSFGGDLSSTTNEDTMVNGTVSFTDLADGDSSLGFVVSSGASAGIATIDSSGNWSYMPGANYHGPDSFEVSVTDDDGNSESQVINLTVLSVADLLAQDDAFSGDEDTVLTGDVANNDSTTSGGTLGYAIAAAASSGVVTLNSIGSFTYQPNANFNGSDSFSYVVTDPSAGESDTRTVSLNVNAVNDAPVAVGDSYSVDQDNTLSVSAPGVLGNDWDIDAGTTLSAIVVNAGPRHGSLTLAADGSFDYTPNSGFSGSDSFTYVANDGALDSNPVAVSITVNEVASGPNLAYGVVSGVGGSWVTVDLPSSYTSMVVVATANYDDTSGPGVVRIQNAFGSSFEMLVQAAGGSAPNNIDVHYTVMEEGVYDEAGFKLEAVKYNSSVTDENNSWSGEARTYGQSYSKPIVVGQVMTYNDADWSNFWSRGSSRTAPPSSSLFVGKMVGEDADNTRADETIGYFVIESSSDGVIEGLPFRAGLGGDTVKGVDDAPAYQYSYDPFAAGIPKAAVVSMAGMDGGNGGWAFLYGDNPLPTAGGGGDLYLAIDEDQSKDNERRHTTEQVAYFIIDPPVESGDVERSTKLALTKSNLSPAIRPAVEWSRMVVPAEHLSSQRFDSSKLDQRDEQQDAVRQKMVSPNQASALEGRAELLLSVSQLFEERGAGDIDFGKLVAQIPDAGEIDTVRLDELFESNGVDWMI